MKASARSSGGSSNTTEDDSRSAYRTARKRRLPAVARVKWSVADRTAGAVVHPLAQILPRLEVRYVLARKRHRLAGLRIAPLTRRPKVQREAAEAPDLDALSLRKRIAHDLENLLQRQLDVLGRQVLLLGGDDLDQFGLRHA